VEVALVLQRDVGIPRTSGIAFHCYRSPSIHPRLWAMRLKWYRRVAAERRITSFVFDVVCSSPDACVSRCQVRVEWSVRGVALSKVWGVRMWLVWRRLYLLKVAWPLRDSSLLSTIVKTRPMPAGAVVRSFARG